MRVPFDRHGSDGGPSRSRSFSSHFGQTCSPCRSAGCTPQIAHGSAGMLPWSPLKREPATCAGSRSVAWRWRMNRRTIRNRPDRVGAGLCFPARAGKARRRLVVSAAWCRRRLQCRSSPSLAIFRFEGFAVGRMRQWLHDVGHVRASWRPVIVLGSLLGSGFAWHRALLVVAVEVRWR